MHDRDFILKALILLVFGLLCAGSWICGYQLTRIKYRRSVSFLDYIYWYWTDTIIAVACIATFSLITVMVLHDIVFFNHNWLSY